MSFRSATRKTRTRRAAYTRCSGQASWRYPGNSRSMPRSHMMAKLIARSKTLGVISLVSAESGRVLSSNPRSLRRYSG